MNDMEKYQRWLQCAGADADVSKELRAMGAGEIEDAFYRDLTFGTGGLRGVIGAGTNRMNRYTVAQASQGLANYVASRFAGERRRIAIAYDSRIKSRRFAQIAAGVLAANGIQAFIYPRLMPTPCLSFAVRRLKAAAGIMITASHNPASYNGYKVYGPDGCQITAKAAEAILFEINKLDIFDDVKQTAFDDGIRNGRISFIGEDIFADYVEEVKNQSVLFGDEADKNGLIVYSPLHGTGLMPVLRTLKEAGFTKVAVVEAQRRPDGRFPTCPYPNPENKEAMALGMAYAEKLNGDLFLATDPDCDRVGIAVRNGEGRMVLLSGNETGLLLLDYLCSQRFKHDQMPDHPVCIKTIVTADMAQRIAAHYGVKVVNVLTGFKFIGEQIGLLEQAGRERDYIFGFEESCGYLTGGYVRDKDAVGGALLICEMFAYYKTRGVSLADKLNELYRLYGYCRNSLRSYTFEGSAGAMKMAKCMEAFRAGIRAFGSLPVEKTIDYGAGLDGLPRANVLKFLLKGNCSVTIRPSGTEPKIKAYLSLCAQTPEEAAGMEAIIDSALARMIAP